MLRPRLLALAMLLVASLLSTPALAAPAPTAAQPTRTVGIGPTIPGNLPYTDQNAVIAADTAFDLGARGGAFAWGWSRLEPWPGYWDFSEVDRQLSFQSKLLQSGRAWMLNVEVVNVTHREVPWDLYFESFDSERFQLRFRAFIDGLLAHMSDPRLQYISLGNEVDAYMQISPGEWQTYSTFYRDAVQYLHTKYPQYKVGVTTTFSGATSAVNQANIARLNQPSDVWISTYNRGVGWYTDTYAQLARAPADDLLRMVALAGGKPVVLQEVAFPSSTALGSSDAIQEQFVSTFFGAWNGASVGDRLVFVNFLQMSDYSADTCRNLQSFYGLWFWPGFVDYYCSVGIVRADASPKPAVTSFLAGASVVNGLPGVAPGTAVHRAGSAAPGQTPALTQPLRGGRPH